MKKFLIIFFLLFGAGLGTAGLISAGWYPAAIVSPAGGGSQIIWAKKINQISRATVNYYQKLGAKITAEALTEARQAALDKLIEEVLISRQLQSGSQAELTARLQETLAKHQDNPELGPAAGELYGLGLEDFYRLVLIPQVQRQLLEKKLAEDGQKLEDWLTQEKAAARLINFIK